VPVSPQYTHSEPRWAKALAASPRPKAKRPSDSRTARRSSVSAVFTDLGSGSPSRFLSATVVSAPYPSLQCPPNDQAQLPGPPACASCRAKPVEVRDVLIDGERTCALTRYELQAPQGPLFVAMSSRRSPCETERSTRSTFISTARLSPSSRGTGRRTLTDLITNRHGCATMVKTAGMWCGISPPSTSTHSINTYWGRAPIRLWRQCNAPEARSTQDCSTRTTEQRGAPGALSSAG